MFLREKKIIIITDYKINLLVLIIYYVIKQILLCYIIHYND